MTTFVLTHGAWGGAYGFRAVRPLLWSAGHEVFTPALTGIGERSHLTGPGVDLDTHVTDVVNLIRYEDLDDIVLVGFSYGGMVVTGCLDRIGDRVRHLVYLDAFVPTDGQSVAQIAGMPTPADAPIDSGNSWLIPPRPRQLESPEMAAWMEQRRSFQPVGTFTRPVSLRRPLEDWPFTLTYVKATADPDESPDSGFWQASRHASASDRWAHHEIATHHLIPVSRPRELADILLTLAD